MSGTPEQQKLVKARKAARIVFVLLIFGGGVLAVYGIYTQYLPTIYDGLVMMAASALPLFLSARIEKKLNLPSV